MESPGNLRVPRQMNEFPIAPPIEPMLAKLADGASGRRRFLYEPKWDGFRAIVFRGGGDVFIQSRDLRPLDRYFPELHDALLAGLPDGCVVDGEIVIATPRGLDFDALQMRLHPGGVARREAREGNAGRVRRVRRARGRRAGSARRSRRASAACGWSRLLAGVEPPIHLTPMTRDRGQAAEWLARFEGAGLDGVIAKPVDGTYQPGKRAMIKVKHARTADCVVAGFRWHKDGEGRARRLAAARAVRRQAARCTTSASPRRSRWPTRRQLAEELAPLRERALDEHPWREWAEAEPGREHDPDARRPEPLERGQGSVVGAAADRARVRGEVRPHAGRSVPPRGDLSNAGVRTSGRATAATISSRSRLLTSSRRSSARPPGIADAAPVVEADRRDRAVPVRA